MREWTQEERLKQVGQLLLAIRNAGSRYVTRNPAKIQALAETALFILTHTAEFLERNEAQIEKDLGDAWEILNGGRYERP